MLRFYQRPRLFTYLWWLEWRWKLIQWGLIHAFALRCWRYIRDGSDAVSMVFRLLYWRQFSLNHKASVVHFCQARHLFSIFWELRLSLCLIMCIFRRRLDDWIFCFWQFLILIVHPILVFTFVTTLIKIIWEHILSLTRLHPYRIINYKLLIRCGTSTSSLSSSHLLL